MKKPDFMTITFDSDAIFVFLIEIEAPAKRWATLQGTPHAKLTEALDQLRDWRVWFQEPENIIQFQKLYQIDQRTLETHLFFQRYALIYGSREEAMANSTFAKKRALIAQPDEVLMTYDRLQPSDRMMHCPTVRLDRRHPGKRFAAVHVPPTFKFGPHNAEQFTQWARLDEAIGRNDLMTNDRREFLVKRLDYWKSWVQQPSCPAGSRFQSYGLYSE